MVKLLGSLLSGSGEAARLTILIYHRVLESATNKYAGEIDACSFDWQLGLLSKYFTIIPLSDAIEKLRMGNLPPRAVCITFDDGYADNLTIALPIIQKWNAHATIFVATKSLNGGCMWNDAVKDAIWDSSYEFLNLEKLGVGRLDISTVTEKEIATVSLLKKFKYLPRVKRDESVRALLDIAGVTQSDSLMLTDEQIKKLHNAGMTIGAHTVNHPILMTLDRKSAMKEISDGKEYLEGIIGEKIKYFAYPNGKPNVDYSKLHVDILKDLNFDAAVTTAWGVSSCKSDFYQLPRFTPWDNVSSKYLYRMLGNYFRKNPDTA